MDHFPRPLVVRSPLAAAMPIGRHALGRLAILACRKTGVDDAREMLNWFVNNDDKYILVVNDETLVDWIRLKDRAGSPTDAIADLYRSLREGVQ